MKKKKKVGKKLYQVGTGMNGFLIIHEVQD